MITATAEPKISLKDEFIPLSVPEIRGNEWKYIKECLDTGWVSSVGSYVDQFEKALASYVGTKHAVATVNGTAALHTALLVAGIQPDDEVLVSTLTFIAPANVIRYVGAWPVFIDAEPNYWQMDVDKVINFINKECAWHEGELKNKNSNRRVRAILPVHVLGHPVDIDPLLEIARKYDLTVIEDATESLGAKYKDRMVGNLGDIACFSFNGNKVITTGGGGMVVTNNEAWSQKAKYLTTQAKDDPIEYIHNEIGYNHRLTNIQAAMGCAQMEQLPNYIDTKRKIAATYTKELRSISELIVMNEAEWAFSIFWMYTVLINDKNGNNSRTLLNYLATQKIQARPLWQPLHLSQAHAGSQHYHCEVAEWLNRTALSLPCSSGLSENQLARVIDVVKAFYNKERR
jgi:perosamine synthetase